MQQHMAMSKPWCDCQRLFRTLKGEVKKWCRWCKAGDFSEDIVYNDMDGQEVPNVGKAIELSKMTADVGRTVFGTSRTKIAD